MKWGRMLEPAQKAEVRRGEWDVSDFLRGARSLVTNPSVHEALYDGLRSKVGHLLRSDAEPAEVAEWRDALVRVIALASSHAESGADSFATLAARLNVLRDLSADTLAKLNAYVPSNLGRQPHFQRCLEVIESKGGTVSRAYLIDALGLKEANGTRVLKLLEEVRLVRRRREQGGTVSVSLTSEGRRALMQWRSPAAADVQHRSVVTLTTGKIDGVRRAGWAASPRVVGLP